MPRTGRAREPVEQRFWKYVSPCPNTGCWWWTGATSGSSPAYQYGHIGAGGTNDGRFIATHLSYRMHVGDVPKGMIVCHRCDAPLCVNPDHLFVGTHKTNVDDCIIKGRKRYRPALGERCRAAKLNAEIAKAIRASDESNAELGRRYGVTRATIRQLRLNNTWKHVE